MKLLQMLKTMITARGLEVLLLGKEVTASNDVSLGIVTSIRKELSQDKIWMVIDNLGRERFIPIEEIARVAKRLPSSMIIQYVTWQSRRKLRCSSPLMTSSLLEV
jgi:hypothetical protein